MSDQPARQSRNAGLRRPRVFRRRRSGADTGMTLPEVTISVVITGIVVATLSMTTTVILRQMDNTEGRTNNARSEQNVGFFMPTDLSSAESVSTEAFDVPCGPPSTLPACPATANVGGSNALMLTWSGSVVDLATNTVVPTTTIVSYRVLQVGSEWQMIRVECYYVNNGSPECNTRVVLRELDPPPPGFVFIPGTTKPSWIMTVSQAAAANDTSGPSDTVVVDPGLKNKNAQRVVVTINGGGDVAGAGGGGRNQISLSAGGTNRESDLATDSLQGAPSFTAARSRCGGNYGVIVDKSGSIGDDLPAVLAGVDLFIAQFAGTPVKLQVVDFASTANTIGAGAGWSKYYDMLVESDVLALRTAVEGITIPSSQYFYTNWEDAFFRMLKNADGTVQAQLPRTILFFTDGMPTRSRLDAKASGGQAAEADPLDARLPGATDPSSNPFYQVGWNRAERMIRDRGTIDIVGVYVSTDTAHTTVNWMSPGAGYHYEWFRNDNVVYERGAYEKANTVVYERGNHQTWDRGNTVVYERGGHATAWQRNNNVTFQYSGTGISYEKRSSSTSSWTAAGSGGATSSNSRTAYFNGNTVPGESDNWRARVTGTLGSWTSMTLADYNESNLAAGGTDGFQSTVGSLSGSWTTVTQAQFDASNTSTSDTDGWRPTLAYSSPYTSWTSSGFTQSNYESGNTTSAETDGWRTSVTGTPTSWTAVTQAQFDESNETSDDTDGWRTGSSNTSPYTAWSSVGVTESSYQSGNTSAGESDGWRTSLSAAPESWLTTTASLYNESNTTSDEADGWRLNWTTTPQGTYESNNSTPSASDLWQTRVDNGLSDSWTPVTQTQYNASNTTSGATDDNDGWRQAKVYAPTYTAYDNNQLTPIQNWQTVGNFVANNNSPTPGGFTVAARENPGDPDTPFDDTGEYVNAPVADLFVLPSYDDFNKAMRDIALGQCGGTVTVQTRIGTTAALDPFTYQNMTTNETVQTSAAYRSGTFDVALYGGASKTVTISPQEFTNLAGFQPVSWSCKSANQPITFDEQPVPDHAPWTSITLTVAPNQAVSCIQQVKYA